MPRGINPLAPVWDGYERDRGRSAALETALGQVEHVARTDATVLEHVSWRIRGAGGAAEQLGLRPTTLETRMKKLGLARPRIA